MKLGYFYGKVYFFSIYLQNRFMFFEISLKLSKNYLKVNFAQWRYSKQ
jgi:hypothetical protein